MKTPSAFFLATFLLLGCNQSNRTTKPPLTLQEAKALICGKYFGSYAKGTEYFKIEPDGRFSQSFVQNGATNYHMEGKWNFKKHQDRYWVTFEPFMSVQKAILERKSPEKLNSMQATFYDDETTIWFFRDIDCFVVKQSDASNTNKVEQ